MKGGREALRHGLACHQEGRLDEAERTYRTVLDRHPDHADACYLLGLVMLARGAAAPAAGLIARAIGLRPGVAQFHAALGDVLAAQEAPREACLCYQEAVRLEPTYFPAWVGLGNALQAGRRWDEAAVAYWRAIQVQPESAQAFDNLGNVLREQGRIADAIDCHREASQIEPGNCQPHVNLAATLLVAGRFAEAEEAARQAVSLAPGMPEALSNLSVALLRQGRVAEAESPCRAALEARPEAAFFHSNLGTLLVRLGRLPEAEAACRRAVELGPGSPDARHGLGAALSAADRLEEAAEEFRAALEVRPEFAEAWTDLGVLHHVRQRQGEALECFDEAVRCAPQNAKAHLHRALGQLLTGQFGAGFEEYEWRLKLFDRPPRALAFPAWNGEALNGRTILLAAEQGLGDTIQFVRYASRIAALGGRVIVDCAARVAPLIASVEGVSQVVTSESELPAFDVQALLMSLPRLLGTDADTIPGVTPYIGLDAARVAKWGAELARLSAEPGAATKLDAANPSVGQSSPGSGPAAFRLPVGRALRVGLAWAGNPENSYDRHRSIPLALLAPFGEAPGVEWYSLHIGERARGQACDAGWLRTPLPDDSDLSDLAAVLASLDLTISVDSMPAHLAGALGRPVWTLLPFTPDWRWQLGRTDSPWYPSMRLFRQSRYGDWSTVIANVAAEFCDFSLQASRPETDMK